MAVQIPNSYGWGGLSGQFWLRFYLINSSIIVFDMVALRDGGFEIDPLLLFKKDACTCQSRLALH